MLYQMLYLTSHGGGPLPFIPAEYGSDSSVTLDVPFGLDAEITVLPDGSASILVGSPEG